MKFRVISDVHQEFYLSEGNFWVPKVLPDDKDTVLIIAGDFGLVKHKVTAVLLSQLCEQFYHVVYVLGNHEYWKHFLHGAVHKLQRETAHIPNFTVLEKEHITLGDTVVIGATLWSDITVLAAEFMNDYRAMRFHQSNPRRANYLDTLSVHMDSVEYIKTILSIFENKNKVIVTHFAPSFKSVAPYFHNSPVNSGYYTDLEWLAEKTDYWVHGHMHNSSDYMIGDCRVLCNPVGYDGELNKDYKDLIFEV